MFRKTSPVKSVSYKTPDETEEEEKEESDKDDFLFISTVVEKSPEARTSGDTSHTHSPESSESESPNIYNTEKIQQMMQNHGQYRKHYHSELFIKNDNDLVYGPHYKKSTLKLGKENLELLFDDTIEIRDVQFSGTKGLYELIFKKDPQKYDRKDLNAYTIILEKFQAHMGIKFNRIKSSRGKKHGNIIKNFNFTR